MIAGKIVILGACLLVSTLLNGETVLERRTRLNSETLNIGRERVDRLREIIERGHQSQMYKDLSGLTWEVHGLREESTRLRSQIDEFATNNPDIAAMGATADPEKLFVLPAIPQAKLNQYRDMYEQLQGIQSQIEEKDPALEAARGKATELSSLLRQAQEYLDEEDTELSRAIERDEELARERTDFLQKRDEHQDQLDNLVNRIWREGKFPQYLLDDLDNEQVARWTAGVQADVLMAQIDQMIGNTRLGMYIKKREEELRTQILDEMCNQVAQCTEQHAIDNTQRQNIRDVTDMIENFTSGTGSGSGIRAR